MGNLVLIEGVDQSIVKTSTIVDNSGLVRGRRANVANIDDVRRTFVSTGQRSHSSLGSNISTIKIQYHVSD